MAFSGVRSVSIAGNAINVVHGDQINQNITAGTIHIHRSEGSSQDSEESEYSEFNYVKRGNLYRFCEISSLWRTTEAGRKMEIHGFGRQREGVHMALSYLGINRKQSSQLSRIMAGTQERSGKKISASIPTSKERIWPNFSELIARTFRLSYFTTMGMYLYDLSLQQDTYALPHNFWINSRQGRLCIGPSGPMFTIPRQARHAEPISVPITADMIKEDVSFRFFLNLGSVVDHIVLDYALHSRTSMPLDDLWPDLGVVKPKLLDWNSDYEPLKSLWHCPPNQLPCRFAENLRFDAIYCSGLDVPIARYVKPDDFSCIWDATCFMPNPSPIVNGISRLSLDPTFLRYLAMGIKPFMVADCYVKSRLRHAWLAQSLSTFNALDTEEGEKKDYYIFDIKRIRFQAVVQSDDWNEPHTGEPLYRYENVPTISLFVYPIPLGSLSDLILWTKGRTHYWSFNEAGESEMSEEDRNHLRLPKFIPSLEEISIHSWPSYVYDAIQKWQVARGFDPITTDFAESLGLPALEETGARKRTNRFEEIVKEPSRSFWTALAGSDISAFAF
ncbi:hypothetical protein Moror_5893 [Moniliophthora roreri MCA 2997]|uniref:Uncharacterized protein n=1 Tax=Moniliophthora roreri (strain MCA 2997) TaxID=1381753 RepID=V2WZ02_MONRO|nr:hypothetical protein Moror_5893 [Moniliophthora roreri MCA 2997]